MARKEVSEICSYDRVHQVQFDSLSRSLLESKQRVERLETTLARGVILLVANLVGVVMTLAQEFLGR